MQQQPIYCSQALPSHRQYSITNNAIQKVDGMQTASDLGRCEMGILHINTQQMDIEWEKGSI